MRGLIINNKYSRGFNYKVIADSICKDAVGSCAKNGTVKGK